MPYQYQWVEPEIALVHNDVTIYHIYKNDYMEEGYRTFWFGYHVKCSDNGDYSFDVRDLPQWNNEIFLNVSYEEQDEYILQVIQQAIDEGVLTQDGVRRS